jgi:hypothetical protein
MLIIVRVGLDGITTFSEGFIPVCSVTGSQSVIDCFTTELRYPHLCKSRLPSSIRKGNIIATGELKTLLHIKSACTHALVGSPVALLALPLSS